MWILPAFGWSSPEIWRSSVDLPQPEGPTNTTNSPSAMSRSMPLRTSSAPNDLRMPCSLIWPIGFPSYFSPVPAMPAVMNRCRNTNTIRTGMIDTTVMARMNCHCTFSSPA